MKVVTFNVLLLCALFLTWAWTRYRRVKRFEAARLADPDYAFPSLDPAGLPHDYDQPGTLRCCKFCGGGSKHAIHTGGPWPPSGGFASQTLTEETERLISRAGPGN